ncbi:MAG: Qnr family pentapeptide repeat protein [Aliivibrio sp.]|uniref:Qnr family pentapeptide repeat protein n=1 Tax=Aliivibrio sp. TaxID=1872443 RepID=UPI001A58F490|nr:Qnr family pentapeptide repeat protein [Aliivibrio sp.]
MHVSNQTFNDELFAKQSLVDTHYENCQFFRCDFRRADLSDATFKHCKFIEQGEVEGCRFDYAKLKNSSFQHCDLSMAHFNGANCYGIELRNCNLQGADFIRSSFANYITDKTFFCSAFITASNLSYANLEDLKLEKCELFDNRWIGANLLGASLVGSDLSGGDFSPDAWGTFDLKDANLCKIDLEGLDPRRVKLEGVLICDWQQEQLLAPLGVSVIAT